MIEIADYDSRYLDAFVKLSVDWISEYWPIEERDHYELEHVEENIIRPGGFILMALDDGVPVGTVAMIAMDGREYDYEFAKFTTTAACRGKGIGRLLVEEALRRADNEGKGRIYIETNHLCEAAIHLYEQYGFCHIPGKSSVFDRGDYLMARIPANGADRQGSHDK